MPHRFSIDRTRPTPVYVQLQEQIRLLVHRGVLKPGDLMPTVRSLAVELGVNANTVTRVYRELQSQGVLRLERGVGSFVAQPTDAGQLARTEFRQLDRRVRELVQRSREAGLTFRELVQMVGSTWKEIEEASRDGVEPASEGA